MANKRFLGLGFSFSATDKGLEKKLLSVKGALDGIAESLNTINSTSLNVSTGTAIGKGQPRQERPTPIRQTMQEKVHAMAPEPEPAPAQTDQVRLQRGALGDSFSKLNDQTKAWLTDTFSGMNKVAKVNVSDNFFEQLSDVNVMFDKTGKLTKESQKNLSKTMQQLLTGSRGAERATSLSSKAFAGLGKILVGVRGYIRDVGHSVSELLSSVGVNLRDMVPPQLFAAFNLAKTALAPLMNIPSFFTRFFKTKAETKYQQDIAAFTKMSNDQSGFTGGSDTLKNALLGMSDAQGGEKKQGIFDKLKNALSGLFGGLKGLLGAGGVAVAGGAAVSAVSKIFDAIKAAIVGVATYLATAFKASTFRAYIGMFWEGVKSFFVEGGAGVIARAGSFFSELIGSLQTFLMSPIKSIAGRLSIYVAAFFEFKAALTGLFEGVKKGLDAWTGMGSILSMVGDSIKRFFIELGGLASDLGAWVSSKVSGLFRSALEAVGLDSSQVMDGLKSAIGFIGNIFSTVFDAIKEGFSKIGEWIVGFPAYVLKNMGLEVGTFFDDASEKLRKYRQNIQANTSDQQRINDNRSQSPMNEPAMSIAEKRLRELGILNNSPTSTLTAQSEGNNSSARLAALTEEQLKLQQEQLDQTKLQTETLKNKNMSVNVNVPGNSMSAAATARRNEIAEALSRGTMGQTPLQVGGN